MLDACSRIDDKTAARDNLYLLVERIRKVKVVNHRSRFLSIPTALHFASATPLSRNIARVCQWKESAAQIEQQFVFRADRRWFLRNRTLSIIIVIDGCLIIAAVFNQSPILFAQSPLEERVLSLSLFFYTAPRMIANTLKSSGCFSMDRPCWCLPRRKRAFQEIRARTDSGGMKEWDRKWSIVSLIVEILRRSSKTFICRALGKSRQGIVEHCRANSIGDSGVLIN